PARERAHRLQRFAVGRTSQPFYDDVFDDGHSTITRSQHHNDTGMVAQLLVEGVELLARGCAHHAGDAQVASLPAGTHLHRCRVEIRSVPQHHVHHFLSEARLLATHDLDGEVAGEGERRALDHRYADSASRLPARITLRL